MNTNDGTGNHLYVTDTLHADCYAQIDYISNHKFARRALENLFFTPMNEFTGLELLIKIVSANPEEIKEYIEARKQIDTLVELGGLKRTGSVSEPKYAITFAGHDACVTYRQLFGDALAKEKTKSGARKLVRKRIRQN